MPANSDTILIFVNEEPRRVAPGCSIRQLRDRFKPAADILIDNGHPVTEDVAVGESDRVVLIKRGEVPSSDELEALMVARHGPGIHEKVKRARVGIAGCGGLGSAVAIALARLGVGVLRLVDYDIVEPSNLNRQQFFIDQIGRMKTDALAENLARINPYVKTESIQMRLNRANIAPTFADCDAVAECFDDPIAKRDMTVAMRHDLPHVPLVTVSGIAGIGPSDKIGIRKIFDNIWMVGDGETEAAPGQGLLAPRVAVAAGHQANVILRILLGEEF
ncbi:sulfur carrier protein ThiS adenylyltransferase ThiF [bacterium]|nr:sulfur carrier protein ThiS adenylyltransferase ThiF [bacterium]